jgi:hypothetical protein
VPRVEFERRPEVGSRGQVEAETGQVDGGVGHEEQDGAKLSYLVQRTDKEAHACRNIEIGLVIY